jgi:hypothetical protein
MESGKKNKTAMPVSMVIAPSKMKIQRQLAMFPMPSIFEMPNAKSPENVPAKDAAQ